MLDKKVSTAVFQRDGWKCRNCRDRSALHPHHVVYSSHQGTDTLDNIITLCASCHRAHHDGHLKIHAGGKTANNIYVFFERVGKWKPGT